MNPISFENSVKATKQTNNDYFLEVQNFLSPKSFISLVFHVLAGFLFLVGIIFYFHMKELSFFIKFKEVIESLMGESIYGEILSISICSHFRAQIINLVKVLKNKWVCLFTAISFALGFSSPLANHIFKPPRSQYMCETKWDQHLFHANSAFLKTALFKK